MKTSFTIQDLPQDERPRERLQKVGVDNLSLQELLAGGEGQNVLTIVQNILAHFGSPGKIKQASIEELQKVKGIGFANACKLKAAFKIGERAQTNHKRYGQKNRNSRRCLQPAKKQFSP